MMPFMPQYVDYLAEKVDQTISYSKYLAEQLDKNMGTIKTYNNFVGKPTRKPKREEEFFDETLIENSIEEEFSTPKGQKVVFNFVNVTENEDDPML